MSDQEVIMVRRKISRRTPGYLKISLWIVFVAIVISLVVLVKFYRAVFSPSVSLDETGITYFYIPQESDYEYVLNSLLEQGLIESKSNFEWVAKKKNYKNNINPGRYLIREGMSNNELVNLLRSGKQEPLMFSFNNLRTLDELADVAGKVLEAGPDKFREYFNDPETPGKYGFTRESFPAMFIPNSYEVYWTTGPEKLTERMKREYVAFWSDSRIKKAEKIGLSPVEVIILASIVDQETLYDDENARIAGVLINRLQKGIPLQSDPTIIFAKKIFNVRRVINEDRKVDSPYNTYKYPGLPPGPICIPSIAAIEGCLDYEKHNYYYFCAKPDFSGYHSFARTLSQHNENARLYQQELNRRKIYR